jgi:GNAT superfamily N-acetyltransferase
MTTRHFWADAPACGWASYLWRTVAGRATQPTVLPTTAALNPAADPIHPSLRLEKAAAAEAEEYSQFLEDNFYSAGPVPLKMRVPKALLEDRLKSGAWIGSTARTRSGRLVGCVFSKGAGFLDRYETGIVDYLCVIPSQRKTGVADALLRALYHYCMNAPTQRIVQFFKHEGAFKPLPPISHDLYYGRPVLRGMNSYRVEHGELTRELWGQLLHTKHQDDIALMNYRNEPSELRYAFYGTVYVVYKPTYEHAVSGKEHAEEEAGRCMLVDWWSLDSHIPMSDLEESVLIIVDSLPYNYVYAASTFPSVNGRVWRVEGTIGVYAFHLDPGVPFKRCVRSAVTW